MLKRDFHKRNMPSFGSLSPLLDDGFDDTGSDIWLRDHVLQPQKRQAPSIAYEAML